MRRLLQTCLVAMIGLLWAGPCSAAVTYDTLSTGTNSLSSLTIAHTTANQPNRAMYISCAVNNDTGSSATYNSVSMTALGNNTDGPRQHITFRLVAPATGTNNAVITFSGATGSKLCKVVTFYNVDQVSPDPGSLTLDADPGGVTTGDNHNVTCATGGMVWESIFLEASATSLAILAGQTQRSTDTGFQMMTSTKPGAGTTNVGHTWDGAFSHHLENSVCISPAASSRPTMLGSVFSQ